MVLKESEHYDSMRAGLNDLRREVESLASITVDKQTFAIEYFLGGDWKFLAMATEIDSASSTFACIWCKCPADQRANTTKKWSATDTECGARLKRMKDSHVLDGPPRNSTFQTFLSSPAFR